VGGAALSRGAGSWLIANPLRLKEKGYLDC
jgi:hypothetical protein